MSSTSGSRTAAPGRRNDSRLQWPIFQFFKIEPTHLVFDGKTPSEQDVHVSATWPKLAYEVSTTSEWLKAKPQRGFTPDDVVHVRVDPSQLKPGHYSATLTLSAWQAGASPPVLVDVDVAAKDMK